MTEKEQKVLSLLHMARRAGKMQMGFNAVERSCFAGNASLQKTFQNLPDVNWSTYSMKQRFNTSDLAARHFSENRSISAM